MTPALLAVGSLICSFLFLLISRFRGCNFLAMVRANNCFLVFVAALFPFAVQLKNKELFSCFRGCNFLAMVQIFFSIRIAQKQKAVFSFSWLYFPGNGSIFFWCLRRIIFAVRKPAAVSLSRRKRPKPGCARADPGVFCLHSVHAYRRRLVGEHPWELMWSCGKHGSAVDRVSTDVRQCKLHDGGSETAK